MEETVNKQVVIDAFKVWLIDNNDMRRFEEVVRDLQPVKQIQTCEDAVSRQAIKEKKIYSEERHEYIVPIAYIDWLPSVTPTRPKGKWMQTNDFIINLDGQFIYKFICSECKSLSYFRTSNKKAIGANVCPNCGADMREGEADGH